MGKLDSYIYLINRVRGPYGESIARKLLASADRAAPPFLKGNQTGFTPCVRTMFTQYKDFTQSRLSNFTSLKDLREKKKLIHQKANYDVPTENVCQVTATKKLTFNG